MNLPLLPLHTGWISGEETIAYDCGGTFDISVLEIAEGVFESKQLMETPNWGVTIGTRRLFIG